MKYEITEEQIKELSNKFGSDNETCLRSGLSNKLKEWFPDAFKEKLTLGRWYKNLSYGNLVFYVSDENMKSYGFCYSSNIYMEEITFNKGYCWDVATDSEVLEALTNEAKKRGLLGSYITLIKGVVGSRSTGKTNNKTFFDEEGCLCVGSDLGVFTIFSNGTWATPIKTYTKEEAEKMLNAKIV